MHRFDKALRGRRSVAAALGLIVGALALSACGSSSSSNSNSSSSTSSSGGAGTSQEASTGGKPSWCGDKPITLGIYDGGGLNAWSADSLAQVKREAAKCPAVKKQIVVNAGFNPQKGTSGMQSMIAQGANAIVAIPDAGVCAELPTMRQATQRGVKVAIYAAAGCGKVGQDYVSYSDWDTVHDGKILTDFVAKQMNGKGNILFLGGPAGNIVDQGTIKGMYESLKAYPNIKVLGNVTEKSWPVTNWDPAQAQKVTAGLLAKYPKVDAIVDEYGASVLGELKAFKDAGRKVPAIATSHLNALACDWEKAKGTKNAFELATLSNRNWTGALAVRKAVAAVNGIKNTDKEIIPLTLLTDSSSTTNPPKCYADKSPDYDPSNDWSEAELNKVIAGA
ncbi:MAG: ribose transport system substrate-binding protein [Solirubrobacteraceae bacterium]|jgi:ribose transport system substrate-binding protein|nr:ribose transport system substrate-binding protein [Solirubrobacteraceae bacterium]